jgi:hypothetical protein
MPAIQTNIELRRHVQRSDSVHLFVTRAKVSQTSVRYLIADPIVLTHSIFTVDIRDLCNYLNPAIRGSVNVSQPLRFRASGGT